MEKNREGGPTAELRTTKKLNPFWLCHQGMILSLFVRHVHTCNLGFRTMIVGVTAAAGCAASLKPVTQNH